MGSLTDYLDKGASLGRDAPCLVEGDRTLSYGDVQELSHRVAGALARDGIEPGGKVGILSSNNAVAFACVFGIARRGAVWCPINPRNEIAENRALLELFDCECLIYHAAYAPMVEQLDVRTKVCLDALDDWLATTEAYADDAKERLVTSIARQGELTWMLARLESEWLELADALDQLAPPAA